METFAEPSAGGAATQAAKYVAMEFKKPTPLDSIEKAYDIRCKGPDGLAQLNTENVTISNIPLYDMRSIVDTLSLDVQGFLVVDLPSRMNYADFFDEEKLRTVYAEEIRSYLLDSLGATCVFFHECVVSSSVRTVFQKVARSPCPRSESVARTEKRKMDTENLPQRLMVASGP